MTADLTTTVGKIQLKNPVLTASGTFGYGEEYAEFYDLSALGGVIVKGTTLEPREGNPPTRIAETPAGMLNAIGLQNPGIDAVIADKLPTLSRFDTAVIVNISGRTVDEYVELARRLDAVPSIAGIEVNISCPNVEHGGMQFGIDPVLTRDLVQAVRGATVQPLIVKLSPNVTDILAMGAAAVEAGADALSAINTLLGMTIDVERRRPVLANVTGGLSGPAIRPVAVRMVWQLARELDVPIIGSGGIMTARDAVEFILAGACAVAVGTANFVDPRAALKVVHGLRDFCGTHGVSRIADLVGAMEAG